MSVFKFICNPLIAENLILGNALNHDLTCLINKEVELCLKTTNEKFQELIKNREHPIVIRWMNNATEIYKPVFFNDNETNEFYLENFPSAAYFDYECENDINKIIPQFEINKNSINYFKGSFADDFLKNKVFKKKWGEIFTNSESEKNSKFRLPKSNSILINDPYLFSNDKKINNKIINHGENNLINLLSEILPLKSNHEYHIAIFTSVTNWNLEIGRNKSNELIKKISNLRSYDILFELIIWDTNPIHKRFLISNFFSFSVDKGFSIFDENCKIIDDNDIQVKRIFHDIGQPGLTPYEQNLNLIRRLSKIYFNCITFCRNFSPSSGKMFFSSNENKQNRLLN